jgi:hypothetical protein
MGGSCVGGSSLFDDLIADLQADAASVRLVEVGLALSVRLDGVNTFAKHSLYVEVSAIGAVTTFTTITTAKLFVRRRCFALRCAFANTFRPVVAPPVCAACHALRRRCV